MKIFVFRLVAKCLINHVDDKSALVEVMGWHWLGNKPLPEPMLTKNVWHHMVALSGLKALTQWVMTYVYIYNDDVIYWYGKWHVLGHYEHYRLIFDYVIYVCRKWFALKSIIIWYVHAACCQQPQAVCISLFLLTCWGLNKAISCKKIFVF